MSYIIKKRFTRNDIAEQIIGIALKKGLVVFGGYVRDRDILGLETFNDIDLAYFSQGSYKKFNDSLKNAGFIFSLKSKSPVEEESSYVHMSKNIISVNVLKVSGMYGMNFPEYMHISVDLVESSVNRCEWEDTEDTDFSCNLFFKDLHGLHLKYNPPCLKEESLNIDPFTFWRNITLQKKFYPVMGGFDSLTLTQLRKLHSRATKLVENDWKMYFTEYTPFTVGIYKTIKIKGINDCSICLNDFNNDSIIVNTICKHSFCNDCFQKVLDFSDHCIETKCPNCRKSFHNTIFF